jgi:outer membrane immunogenic protein
VLRKTEQENAMKRILMAGAVALVAVTQAIAADLPPPMAPPPRAPAAYVPVVSPAYNWSGFYIGLNAGYGFGDSTWNTPLGNSPSFGVNGAMGGATIGGNYQIGQIVLGFEGDYDWQNLRGSATSGICTVAGSGSVISGCDTASNWYGTFRGRLGYAMDRIMIYATAGGAVTDIKASTAANSWASNTELGWAAGAGIEGAITDNLTAKVEYLFADYSNGSCTTASCTLIGSGGTNTGNVKFYENMVRAGLNYKFSGF